MVKQLLAHWKVRSAMTQINSDRVNTLKEKFTFTFKRFVEYRNQQIVDALIKKKNKGYEESEAINPLSLDELHVAWSFYEDNYEWLEELVYNAIAENYLDSHGDELKGGK